MRSLSEIEMAEIVEGICATIAQRSDTMEIFDMESLFDERAKSADIADLYEICRRVQHRCSANDIVLVQCEESALPSDIQPWKVEYQARKRIL